MNNDDKKERFAELLDAVSNQTTSDEAELTNEGDSFETLMEGIKPIKTNNKASLKKKPPVFHPEDHDDFSDMAVADMFSDAPAYDNCPEVLNFSRSGVQSTVLRTMRQGKMPVEHVLDLHGLTVQQSRKELIDFLNDCEIMELRHVIIVHGKGFRSRDKPVIKPMVNRWLQVAPTVLAFHTAQPEDGGSGAVYVLLKKFKK